MFDGRVRNGKTCPSIVPRIGTVLQEQLHNLCVAVSRSNRQGISVARLLVVCQQNASSVDVSKIASGVEVIFRSSVQENFRDGSPFITFAEVFWVLFAMGVLARRIFQGRPLVTIFGIDIHFVA